MNDRKSPKETKERNQSAESVSVLKRVAILWNRSQQFPTGMQRKESKIVNHIEGIGPRESDPEAKRYQNPFITSVRKYRDLRGLVPEWKRALEIASLLVKLASLVPNRQFT